MSASTITSKALDAFLAGLTSTDCIDDSVLARALYSTDASIYRVVPAVVARPRSREELIEVARAALAAGLPITARGAGTSCAGNAVGDGLVIDMSAHLNRVLSIDPHTRTAIVQPGVIQASLQQAARPWGLRFGPDPSTSNRCTIAGMIANNACGPRALGYGRSCDNVTELELLTGTGELVHLTRDDSSGRFTQLRELVGANLATIRTEFGQFSRQVSGYSLEHLLPENRFNLPAFFAGSEGTLGIITQASLTLVSDAPVKVTVALGYPTMPQAGDDITHLLGFKPTACEGMDRRLTDVVAQRLGEDAMPALPRGDAWMFIELVGDDLVEVSARAHALVAASASVEGWVLTDPAEAAPLWVIRSDAAGLAGVALADPAYPGWEDAAVPPAALGAYLRDFDDLLQTHGMHGLPYGHFGDGCVHCRIDFPLIEADGPARYRAFIVDAAKLVAKYGGSMSGEHGDGRARSELLPLMYSPAALELFGQVKQIFDPKNLLNPGVLVDPLPLAGNVRVHQVRASVLRRSDPDFAAAVHQCSGVGKCLANTTGSGAVMCPSFQATRAEKDSTRGRARVLQEMINGELITGGWRSPQVREALDLCLSCKGCRRDCPAGVDMAAYKAYVLDQAYRGRLRPLRHYALGWLPRWGRLVTRLRLGWLANFVLQTPGLKHAARALAGVDQRRPMPRFRRGGPAKTTPAPAPHARARTGQVSADPATQSGQVAQPGHTAQPSHTAQRGPVAIWVDSFTDAFAGNQLAALLTVLADAGYDPQVIGEDACCGLTWITTGQLDGARRQLRAALKVLGPIAESGTPIVGMEPSCLAVWRSDAAELLGDEPRVALVANSIKTLAELLNDTPGWQSPNLAGHTIVAQPHCHHSSVLGWAADAKLLASTGADVVTLGGCCGLAGNFGVEKGHYEVSVKVAEHDLLPAIKAAGPEAIILADGFSCRKQVKDLEGSDAMTLAQLLAAHR